MKIKSWVREIQYSLIMGSRNLDKEMLKSHRNLSTTVKLCKDAHTGNKLARFKGLLDTLQTTFIKFDEDYALYKDDIIKKVAKTEIAFNEVAMEEGIETPSFEYNDKWAEEQFSKYVDTRDLLEDVLDAAQQSPVNEVKTVDTELTVDSAKAEFLALESSIGKLMTEIDSHHDEQMSASSVMGYKDIIGKLETRIDVDLMEKVQAKLAISTESTDPEFSNTKFRIKFRSFVQEQKEKLDSCSLLLVKKSVAAAVEQKPDLSINDSGSFSRSERPREQVFLEKTKPPKFNGDDLEYPEFKRKWSSQVSKANLPEETELDKLRDAIPTDAKDQLYGVTKLEEAWTILTKRFGDEMVISQKLKKQLKSVNNMKKCHFNFPPKIILRGQQFRMAVNFV